MRFLFVAALVFFAPFAVAQQWEAAPLVGPWDYGENRCELRRYGYPTETAAVAGGAWRHYASTRTCPWQVDRADPWGTPENPSYGECGSTSRYPKSALGVESSNARHYFLRVTHGSSCQYDFVDGLVVFRKRSVKCPLGYATSGVKCVRTANTLDVHKNNNTCPAGANGSNPVHTALGTKLQREVDIDLGKELMFVRYYSSATHWGVTPAGEHWRHTGWLPSICPMLLAPAGTQRRGSSVRTATFTPSIAPAEMRG